MRGMPKDSRIIMIIAGKWYGMPVNATGFKLEFTIFCNKNIIINRYFCAVPAKHKQFCTSFRVEKIIHVLID